MPNPKTIKEIESELKECDFKSKESIHSFTILSLLSLLDEVEKRLPEERKSLDYSDQTQAHIRGSNWCRQQVIKILSDLREGK